MNFDFSGEDIVENLEILQFSNQLKILEFQSKVFTVWVSWDFFGMKEEMWKKQDIGEKIWNLNHLIFKNVKTMWSLVKQKVFKGPLNLMEFFEQRRLQLLLKISPTFHRISNENRKGI